MTPKETSPMPNTTQEPNEPAREHIWAVYEKLSQWVAEMEAEQQKEEDAA